LTRINPAADEPAKKAADALVVALNEEEIVAELKEQNPQNTQESKIALNVGTKP
jgi:bifunctional ADP-heptose synthase (sugar kinase/adenylyltransferase)